MASDYLPQLHWTYRCTAMHRLEPALVVHSDAPIGLAGRNCFPWFRRGTHQRTLFSTLLDDGFAVGDVGRFEEELLALGEASLEAGWAALVFTP